MSDNFSKIGVNIIKRWWIIVLLGIICAGALMFEKNNVSEFSIKSGDIYISQAFSVSKSSGTEDVFRYDKYLNANIFIGKFLPDAEQNFEFDKFDKGWSKLSDSEKSDWIRKHILPVYFGEGQYEVTFILKSTDAKDSEYSEANLNDFMNYYINYIKAQANNHVITATNSISAYPKEIPLSHKNIVFKYGIIGFVLGCLIGIVSIVIYTLGRRHV
ncbi:hypothetical protein [Megasphaera sp.]|uniref:hypothetical protein n=1 Tax=Megasphaera sp. TaxID=2023260 RepID=UPI0040286F0C